MVEQVKGGSVINGGLPRLVYNINLMVIVIVMVMVLKRNHHDFVYAIFGVGSRPFNSLGKNTILTGIV